MHLIMHLILILALVKVINNQLSRTLMYNDKGPKIMCRENLGKRFTMKYIFFNSIEFVEIENNIHFDLKFLCKLYDNLSTCIHLLEKCYGLQIFISIWLMFTSGVVGVTVLVTNKVTLQWLVVLQTILPFFWCFIGCYINDQISKEVNQTITLIIKCLIDFRCVPSRKPVLETFKELVSNDRLQFTACSLFKLSYSMLLGTMLNVITYSIILIQMF
nr:uncharacterized protein LOC110380520 [Helicoverpa armigera]